MGYYSGAAGDMAAVRTALISATTAEGWVWDAGNQVLHKGAAFVRLQIVSGYLTLLGRTGLTSGSAPAVVRLGTLGDNPITWPANYEIFVFDDEVFLILNFSVDYYQWLAFGLSTVGGLPGSGMWVAATGGSTVSGSNQVNISATGGGATGTQGTTSAALFWGHVSTGNTAQNCFVHHDLNGRGWDLSDPGNTSYSVGVQASAPLIGLLPNTWNSEAVLLPIRSYAIRPASRLSLIADLQHARFTRIDNYEPGQIIEVGGDYWKVFPWYRKNSAARNGGAPITHSGTFGWALRYEGP